MRRRVDVLFVGLFAVAVTLSTGGLANAHERVDGTNTGTAAILSSNDGVLDDDHQHGGSGGHLDPAEENVDMLGRVRLTNTPSAISDVAVLGNYAYLGEWAAGRPTPRCRGGVYVVDISDPTDPARVGFLPSHRQTYVTEGLHALHVETSTFSGDILVISNEDCGPRGIGGLTIWDITDPLDPVKLSEDGGDYTNGHFEDPESVDPVAHESHSAMAWQDGDSVYVIAVDNEEDPNDLDFFDITDPANPVLIAETGIGDWGDAVVVNANGTQPTSHDFDVRFVDGHWFAMVSYWDAGWVLLNVDDPSSPTLVDDSDYAPCDAFIPTACPPEGNAHQGEWNEDGTLFIGTDEDFSPYRLTPLTVIEHTSGPGAVENQPPVGTEYPAGEFSWTIPIASIPDGILNGPVVFGGYGCDEEAASIPPASVLDPFITDPAEERIVVFQRGPVDDPSAPYEGCFFSIKVENGQDAGYDAVIIANHHPGSGFGEFPDAFLCGSQGHPFTVTAHGVCTGHRAMHELFGSEPSYEEYPEATPVIGNVGPKVSVTANFDGWGYVRMLDAQALTEIDQLAIPEEIDPAYASGFGTLSVHEVATERSPGDTSLAYFSWYDGGFRVARFDETGIEFVGVFIDQGGNDFWGVQLAGFHEGRRVVAASDRDYGLYLFTYTGP